MTTIRVEYIRTASEAGTYSSTKVGGSVEFPVPKNAEWQGLWEEAYGALKAKVDAAISAGPEPTSAPPAAPTPNQTAPSTVAPSDPSPTSTTTSEVSQPADTLSSDDDAGPLDVDAALKALADSQEPLALNGCRVMWDPKHFEAQNKRREKVRMKIGCGDQIPGQYINVESSEDDIMTAVQLLRKGDMVNVKGYVRQPWRNSTNEDVYDLELQAVERLR